MVENIYWHNNDIYGLIMLFGNIGLMMNALLKSRI